MNKRKTTQSNISDKINEILAPKELHDPEYNSDDETIAKTRFYQSDDELQSNLELSHIRKKNVRMLQDIDVKYSGKISSRKEMDQLNCVSSEYEESESEGDTRGFSMRIKELDSDDELSTDGFQNQESNDNMQDSAAEEDDDENFESGQDEGSDSGEEEALSIDEDESDYDGGDIMADEAGVMRSESDEDGSKIDEDESKVDEQSQISKDVQKGVAIQNQLLIWEKLLEIRIHSQKVLLKANSLPQTDSFQQFTSHDEFNVAVQKTSNNVENLLSKMCSLQKALNNQYPDIKQIGEKRKRTDYSDDEDKISKLAKKLESDFVNFKDYRNATISKWYDRTKVLVPGAKSSKQPTFDILRNIQGVLSNKDELIKKSQLLKGGLEIIGMKSETAQEQLNDTSESEPVHYSEIYDDTDFYHTQLRELIEFKANTSSNPTEMTKQFIELQKLRNKIKKVVDTRASKGRKIRYAVHNKMVNFMARNDPTEWTDEAKTELFSSLFGSRM